MGLFSKSKKENISNEWNGKDNTSDNLRLEETIRHYDEEISRNPVSENPDNARFLYYKAKALFDLEKYDEAIKYYDEVIAIYPEDENMWLKKSIAFEKIGNGIESKKCFDKYKELQQGHVSDISDEWYSIGIRFNEEGNFKEAIKYFDKILKVNPDDDKIWNHKGDALHHMGKLEDAIICYDKVLEINPNYGIAWNHKGVILGSLGKYEEAKECFSKARELGFKD